MSTRPKFSHRELLCILQDLRKQAGTAEGREIIAARLNEWLDRYKPARKFVDKVQLMYAYFRDPAEPIKPKLLIGAALLYLIIPTDLIPDWVPLLGLTDDIAAITIIFRQLHDVLAHYDERRQLRVASEELV